MGQHAHHAHALNGGQVFFEKRGLVGQQNVGALGAFSQLIPAGRFVNGYIAQGLDGTPIHIAGVEYPTVKNDNLH